MSEIVYLLCIAGVTHAARGFFPGADVPGAGAALSLGYLLLSAYFAGRLFHRLRLPHLTGYLVVGLVAGPHGLGFLSTESVGQLDVFSSLAVALIALGAGGELSLKEMRPLARSIASITSGAMLFSIVAISATAFALRPFLPFLSSLPLVAALAVALVLGVVLTAQSPSVVMALRSELGASGPLTRTVLGLVVAGDVATIVLFSFAGTGAKVALGGEAGAWSIAAGLSWELFGSIAAGALIGGLIAAYLGRVKQGAPLFIVAACLVIGEVTSKLKLEPVLIGLTAGAVVRNLSASAEELADAVNRTQLPVYVVFFGVSGARIHLDALAHTALPALALVAVRAAGMLSGARLGAKVGKTEPGVARYAGVGMLPQAGLAIALATTFERAFPTLGAGASALTLGVVAINELAAPATYRFALLKAGEVAPAPPAPEEEKVIGEKLDELGAGAS